MTSSSRHVLALVPLLFGSCVQFHLAATCARGAVVRIWLDLLRETGLTRAVVYRLSISYALIRTSDTETSIRAISKFWSSGVAEYCISLCPKMRYAFPRSPRVLISYFSVSYFKILGVPRGRPSEGPHSPARRRLVSGVAQLVARRRPAFRLVDLACATGVSPVSVLTASAAAVALWSSG